MEHGERPVLDLEGAHWIVRRMLILWMLVNRYGLELVLVSGWELQ